MAAATNLQRKAVVPKKSLGGAGTGAAADDDENSPRGLNGEDAHRLNEMESRVMGLEDQLARALDEVREARMREMGLMNVMRDMIGHLGAVEQGESESTNIGTL
jgi:osomolarity two-component system response regulator SKN7